MLVGEEPPVRPTPVCTSSKISRRSRSSHTRASPEERGRDTRTPPSPWIGSIMMAPGFRPDRGLDRIQVAERDWSKPRPSGRSLRVFRLAAGGDGRQRAAVEGALEGQHAIALGMAVDRLALARHLDRRFVRLGAGIGEENEVGEGGVGEAAREALASGSGTGWRCARVSSPGGQRLDEMGMGVPTEVTAMPAPKSR